MLADAAQFNEAQCGHRAQDGSERDHHNSVHWVRALLSLIIGDESAPVFALQQSVASSLRISESRLTLIFFSSITVSICLSPSVSFSSVFANANRHMTEFRRLTGRQAEGIEGRFRTTSTWGTETLLSFFACDTAPRGCHYANNSQLV